MKKLLMLLTLAGVAVVIALALAHQRYTSQALAFENSPVRVTVQSGDSLRRVGRRLREAGIHVPDWSLQAGARYRGDAGRIQAGTYDFAEPMTLAGLFDKLVSGEVAGSKVLIVEGWRFEQMRSAILANTDLTHDLSKLPEDQLMARIGASETKAEGMFFPSTYTFAVGASDETVYRQAYKQMQSVLNDAWSRRPADTPLKSPYEVLVLASVVEKETGIEPDRDVIAGVFVNRLNIDMMLQSDPTTIYGLGDKFDGDLRRRDLRTDTPFNTYTRKGLPPTPIALSSKASIESVLSPAKTEALYFVARGDGSSQFSKTLAEHERAVRKYQLGQRKKKKPAAGGAK